MVIRNRFLWKKERNYQNINFVQRRKKVHIKKKGKAYEFEDKEKVGVMDFW